MTFEYRRPVFNLSGSLSAGCSALDTQITSSAFTSLPTDYTTGLYLPLVLANDAQGKAEVVWVTGHASASQTVTIARGKEGTTAQPFDAGDVVRCAWTLRDATPTLTRATLPADAHYGMRAAISDESLVVEKTASGWNDSAPYQAAIGRKHMWQQLTGGFLDPGTPLLATGMTSGASGTIATYTAGKLRLNRAGLWSLSFQVYSVHDQAGWFANWFDWSGGAFTEQPFQRLHRSYVTASNGQLNNRVTWVGYVTATQAALDISLWLSQINAGSTRVNTMVPQVSAEYLGA